MISLDTKNTIGKSPKKRRNLCVETHKLPFKTPTVGWSFEGKKMMVEESMLTQGSWKDLIHSQKATKSAKSQSFQDMRSSKSAWEPLGLRMSCEINSLPIIVSLSNRYKSLLSGQREAKTLVKPNELIMNWLWLFGIANNGDFPQCVTNACNDD